MSCISWTPYPVEDSGLVSELVSEDDTARTSQNIAPQESNVLKQKQRSSAENPEGKLLEVFWHPAVFISL